MAETVTMLDAVGYNLLHGFDDGAVARFLHVCIVTQRF